MLGDYFEENFCDLVTKFLEKGSFIHVKLFDTKPVMF